jgi:hypothetical protein
MLLHFIPVFSLEPDQFRISYQKLTYYVEGWKRHISTNFSKLSVANDIQPPTLFDSTSIYKLNVYTAEREGIANIKGSFTQMFVDNAPKIPIKQFQMQLNVVKVNWTL